MDISAQSQMQFGDKQAMMMFLGDHAFAHQSISDAVIALGNGAPPDFPMTQFGDINDWLEFHASVHDAIAMALNLGTTADLRDVDLQDEQQFYDWMFNHQLMHQRINQTLGL